MKRIGNYFRKHPLLPSHLWFAFLVTINIISYSKHKEASVVPLVGVCFCWLIIIAAHIIGLLARYGILNKIDAFKQLLKSSRHILITHRHGEPDGFYLDKYIEDKAFKEYLPGVAQYIAESNAAVKEANEIINNQ